MSRNLSQTKRQIIFARDGWKCVYCGLVGKLVLQQLNNRLEVIPNDKKGNEFEIDHFIPITKGGNNSFNNLVTASCDCNLGKSDKIIKKANYRSFIRVNLG